MAKASFFKEDENVSPDLEIIWKDKKRILGMPISFTNYSMTKDRLFIKSGLFTTVQDEILLYRIRDLTLKQTLGQKIFGVGSVIIHSSDKTNTHCELKNVKQPSKVKEFVHSHVEIMKRANRVRSSEFMMTDTMDDCDDFD